MATALLLAGGFSTRYEAGDKAVAPVAGVPMIRRVADRVAHAIDSLVINCRAEQEASLRSALAGYAHSVEYALDPVPDAGPVAGIETGLAPIADEYTLVVACDMPFLDPELVEYLLETVPPREALVPVIDGWYQTTQAVYRTEPMETACARVRREESGRILDAVERLDVAELSERALTEHGWKPSFKNVNTAAALEDATRRFEDEEQC